MRTILLPSLLGLVLLSAPSVAPGAVPSTLRRFHIEQTFQVKPLPAGAKQALLLVPLPSDDPAQTLTGLSIDAGGVPWQVVHDQSEGNAALRMTVGQKGATVHLAFDVARRESAAPLDRATSAKAPSGYAGWLKDDALVAVDDRVRHIAAEVTARASTPLGKARLIYDHTLSTMKYIKKGDGWGRGSIVWACDMKYGNCSDFHALMIGLLRATGIPARFEIGYPVPDGPGGEIPGYHCWAYFYLDGAGWVPVDASEGWKDPGKRDYFFGHHDRDRFALSRGRDLVFPGMRGSALNYFVYPYLEIDGKAGGEVVRQTTYRAMGTISQ